MRLGVTPRSNAHRLQIAQNCDSHFCSPVLDWAVRSSPAFSGTGPDCSPKVSDRTVRSFYRSPFELETGLFFSQTGPYFSVWTTVPIGRTIRSGLFQRSTNKATVRTGLDRGQSNTESRSSSLHKSLLSTDSTYTTTSFEEITGTPAGTAFCTDNDSPSALYNDSGLTVAEVLDTQNFYPFQIELQYSLSLWFLDSRLSAAAIDSYIRNEAINLYGRPFKDCQQWLSILESIPYGIHNDTWRRVSIQFPDELDNGTGRYMLYYQDVTQVISFLISYLPFRDYLHYAPVRLYTDDVEGKPQRVYTEMYTADWWWSMQGKLATDTTIIPVLLVSDKTMMTQHRGD